MEERTISWRRDAATSRTIRLLWALGTGGFLAAIGIIVFSRFAAFADEITVEWQIVAPVVLVVGGVGLLLLLAGTGFGQSWLAERVPDEGPAGRVIDTVAGAAVMVVVVLTLVVGVGGGLGHALATGTIPLALVAVALSSFLRSVGALDVEERRLYLYEPELGIDLEVLESVSSYTLGDLSVLRLRYGQPDGEYVPGPRWLVVPPAVAPEIQAIVED